MNLVELYEQTPVERHKDIKVVGDRVLVRDADGNVAEYLTSEGEELWLVRSNKEQRENIKAIKNKLGITEIAK